MTALFDWHSQDSRTSGPMEIAHTVTQQYGTGGGNTPMVVHDGLLCRATGQAGAETMQDCAPCLNCDHEAPIVAGCLNPQDNQSRRIYGEGGQAPALSARESAGAEQTGVLTRGTCGLPYIIRRLAPLECGRLQGFPDGWAEIAPMDTDDPAEILFWMNVYVTDCKIKGKRVNAEIIKHPAKLARWHDGLHSAAAEYKMWGNGMALPNALFFLQRLQAVMGWCTIRLGSLFDGSGTMPLAAEMCGMRAVWASEVEPYPIAVTRTHLPYMEHLGSVTDIDGGTIPPVDVITFGSPCQDLSIAGRRAGLEGKRCWVQRDCKTRPLDRYRRSLGGNAVYYLGIAADEPRRLARLRPGQVSLLAKYGVTEAGAVRLCRDHGLLSPVYDFSGRGGCFFCPNASLAELRHLRARHPDLWSRLLALQRRPGKTTDRFNRTFSIDELEAIFANEDAQLTFWDSEKG